MEPTRWVIRIFDVDVSDSFKYPLEIVEGGEELRLFLNQSGIEPTEYEKARFLSVGDGFQLEGTRYKVFQIDLKLYDHRLNIGSDALEIHMLVGVKKVISD